MKFSPNGLDFHNRSVNDLRTNEITKVCLKGKT